MLKIWENHSSTDFDKNNIDVPSMSTSHLISGPTARVPKDPQPSVDRIDDLARRILSGDILLPKFQRNFVWEKSQILMLLDSISKGFPIGSVLLWQSRQELRSENKIADLEIDLPRPDYPVNYLLDGQQRLSAICGAMYWKGTDPRSRWNIAYDLRKRAFFHLSSLDDPPLHQVRVNKLSDPVAFFRHLASLDMLTARDKAKLQERAEKLFNRFKDYKIATVTLGDMSIQDVAPIFERINSTGTALTIVDLMRAATWSPEFDLIDSIQAILNELHDKGFGAIDKKVVLRNLSAAAGGGFSAESIDALRHHSPEDLRAAVEDTEKAYKRMVDFLTTHVRVAGAEVIPYVNQLTVLAEVFRQIPTPSAEQYKAINEWFWETALSGYFSGWNTGNMASDLRAVKEFSEGNKEIRYNASMPTSEIWRKRQFRRNTAHTKLLAIVLSHHHPRDLLTGQRIDIAKALAWTNTKEYHHFFPKAYLKRLGVSHTEINCLANFVMLTSSSNKKISDRSPSEYLAMVKAASGDELEVWLASNLISMDAYAAAIENDYERFLNIRANTIHNLVLKNTE